MIPKDLATYVGKNGAHPEYLTFQDQLGRAGVPLPRDINVWDLISDAVAAKGGFMDGSYLVPHELEVIGAGSSVSGIPLGNPGGAYDSTFRERQATARYDDFARQICDGPWATIVGLKDTIVRKSSSARLEAFWKDVDGDQTDVVDFLEYPAGQARRYGTGWVFVDRDRLIRNLEEDLASAPWAYCVPTRNVVLWEFNRAGALEAIVYKRPDDMRRRGDLSVLMIWTRKTWSEWIPTDSSDEPYRTGDFGTNELGEIPAVPIFDGKPGTGRAFGRHNMLPTAVSARDVYNRDSEIRAIERRVACPVLGVLVEDLEDAKGLEVGVDRLLVSTGKQLPGWLEPNLNSLDKLEAKNVSVKKAAIESAGMGGVVGHSDEVETSSGFHSEVELDKSERAVGGFAAALETADNKIARLVLKLLGEPEAKVEVSWPRKFGFSDLGVVTDRTKKRLELNGGAEHDEKVWIDYFSAFYPRMSRPEIEKAAKASVEEHQAAKDEAAKQFQQAGPLGRVKASRAAKAEKAAAAEQELPA